MGVNFRVRIFDREGAERVSRDFSVQILDIKTAGDTAYFLTYTGLVTIRTDGTVREYPLEGEYSSLGVLFENTVVLCSDASAQIRILNPSEEE